MPGIARDTLLANRGYGLVLVDEKIGRLRLGKTIMSARFHEDDVFVRARDRADREHLRKAIDREVAAHRSLCQHYNKAIERIVVLEDHENQKVRSLDKKLRAIEAECAQLVARMQMLRTRQLKISIVFTCLGLLFLGFVVYQTNLKDLVLHFS